MQSERFTARTSSDEPTDAEGFCERGIARIDQNDVDGGIADFDIAITLRSDFVEALVHRGNAFNSKGQFERGYEDFTEALRIDPASDWAYLRRGYSLMELNRFDEALLDLNESIRLNPKNWKGFNNRGVVYARMLDFEAAIFNYNAARELDNDPRILSNRAAVFFELGEFDKAVADCSELIRVHPDNLDWLLRRGDAYGQLEQHDNAIADYSAALRFQPDEVDLYAKRGYMHDKAQNFEAAIADYSEVIRRTPDNSMALLNRGHARYRLEQYDRARLDYDEVIRLDSACASAFLYRGICLAFESKTEQAISDFTESIRLDSTNAVAYRQRAEAWDKLLKFDKSAADFEIAEQLEERDESTMTEHKTAIFQILRDHFDPISLDQLTITERQFPRRVRVDLQRAIDSLIQEMKVIHFSGVRKQNSHNGIDFAELVVTDRNDLPLAVPPQYEEVDIGDDRPIRCLKAGLWLIEVEGNRFAVFLDPESMMPIRGKYVRYQVATINDPTGTQLADKFFRHLESAVKEAQSYRGKILSLEQSDRYTGESSGIKVHKLRTVNREQVILPRATLELLERNVIQFVQQRPRLAELGLSTKKGLLFYGPPGTGKTHTIHYLAGILDGTTTLLISAGQVGL
ncbi:MAG: ftsH3 2, partial [Planctomycetaceae bacterium]|nr:ftsH3 2 [Planctomycetaceae bacterium]